jgi:hypothetical protein
MTPAHGGTRFEDPPRSRRWLEFLRNCFWFVVPVLVFNLVFTSDLPRAYQMDVFWKEIPRGIGVCENVLRAVVLFLPALMPIARTGARLRTAGFALYGVGLVLYFSSWIALMVHPQGGWSTSAIGFTAPAWTPLLWLLGIAMLADGRLFVPLRWFRRWMFVSACVLFVFVHTLHAGLVFTRSSL